MRPTSTAALGLFAALSPAAAGQCVDGHFRYDLQQSRPGLIGSVNAIALWNPDGAGPLPLSLVVGGDFTEAGLGPAARVAMFDGVRWSALGSGIGDGSVHALVVYNGHLIAAGEFETAGGALARRIARFDGSEWHPLGSGMNALVRELAVYGGDLYAAGDFEAAGGFFASHIARWDGSAWSGLGLGLSGGTGLVRGLAAAGPSLYVGGNFTSAGGVPVSNLARWNGTAWSNPGSVNGTVHGLTSYIPLSSPPILYMVGAFTSVAGVPANYVARLSDLPPTWSAMGPGLPEPATHGAIFARTTGPNSHEIIAGAGTLSLVRWNGSAWPPFGDSFFSPVGMSFYQGRYHAFGLAGIGLLDQPNNQWAPPGPGIAGTPVDAASFNGDLYLAGVFEYASGQRVNNIVRWNGSDLLPLGAGLDEAVAAVQVFENKLWVAGDFSTAGGAPANLVARWNGASWEDVGIPGETGFAAALAVHNGELYTAGSIGTVRRWTGSGWASVGGPLGPVTTLASHNGQLYAGGHYNMISENGQISTLARFDAAGGQWVRIPAPVTVNFSRIFDLESFGGALYAGGYKLGTMGALGDACLLRLDTPQGPAAQVQEVRFEGARSPEVRAMHVYNGALYVQGVFNRVGPGGAQTADNFVRFDGSIWTPLGGIEDALSGPAAIGGAMTIHNGELIIGGFFNRAGGQISHRWARWHCTPGMCYPNCDQSTTAPILNVADFSCFLQQFAQGATYANCDGSTTPPTLNVADFSCFLQQFAAGCP